MPDVLDTVPAETDRGGFYREERGGKGKKTKRDGRSVCTWPEYEPYDVSRRCHGKDLLVRHGTRGDFLVILPDSIFIFESKS